MTRSLMVTLVGGPFDGEQFRMHVGRRVVRVQGEKVHVYVSGQDRSQLVYDLDETLLETLRSLAKRRGLAGRRTTG